MNDQHDKPRALFFGTPQFAVPSLRALASLANVVRVVTQPDRPAGRGMKLSAPPVKVLALELGIEVVQPTKVRTPEFAAELSALRADVAVVIAYGRILPPAVLDAPRLGCVNLHASLLPKLRGAAPVQWAIVNGDVETGVCLMQMDEGMDTGAVLARSSLRIGPDETGDELTMRLSLASAELLAEQFPALLRGELRAVPQNHALATHAQVLRKEHGEIDWQRSAQQLHDLVRGMASWPGAYAFLDGQRLKVHRTKLARAANEHAGEAGSVLRADADGIEVACGQGSILLTEVQPEGKSRMHAAAFVAGRRLSSTARFTKSP